MSSGMPRRENPRPVPGVAVIIIGVAILLLSLILAIFSEDQSPQPADPNEIPAEVLKKAEAMGEANITPFFPDFSFKIIRAKKSIDWTPLAMYPTYVVWEKERSNVFVVPIFLSASIPSDRLIGSSVKLFSLRYPTNTMPEGYTEILIGVPEEEARRFSKTR